MPLIPIAMALANFVPMIANWLGGSKAADVATKVVGIAQQVTGQSAPDAALAAIQADPNLELQFKKAMLDQQVQLAQIAAQQEEAELSADTTDAQTVNATMQVEAKADHWPTYTWRPFVGFCYGVEGLLTSLVVLMAYVGVMYFHVDANVLSYLPPMLGSMAGIMGVQTAVLGIASYFRGKMQADPRVPTDNRG
ncbi:hypothetical protein [Paraburkholderia sp. BL10I2N1]|uniref:hypothetical protein n=1 Tax=Paraburkholderia sp. BL10I2N1 TaxID=1938796 RepID=UPI0010E21B7B|nr:hypothetical protein [Paraburkholderia sp. BL10I2N1]TDN70401.1 hypothetical protein B0G77_3874 [Paraburkholderia sp. BL10I2N1]